MTLGPPMGYDTKSYSGKEFRFLVAAMYPTPGVVSGFGVSAQGSPNTTVQVAAGNMIVAATAAGEFGSYQIYNDGTINSPSFAATTTNPRWDYLILRITSGVAALQIVQGTASGSPVAPTITGDNYQPLALIKMPASTTNITSGMITDARTLAQVATGVPPGSVHAMATSALQPGYLFCDGTAVSRATYSGLFAAIGTQHGAGDGSTTFNLPDLRGRCIVALDNQGTAGDAGILSGAAYGGGQTFGAKAGEEFHPLQVAELAAHSHTDSGHAHQQQAWSLVAGGSNTVALQANAASSVPVNVNTVAASANISTTGSGTGHNTMQPFILLTYQIKT